jgi:hypothetical protein
VGQILQGNAFALGFGGLYNVLGNGVVLKGSGSAFFASKPFQESGTAFFTRPCLAPGASRLNSTTNLLSFFSILVKPFGRVFGSIRSDCNVPEAKVHSNKRFHFPGLRARDLYGLAQEKLVFAVHQIRLSLDIRQIVPVMAHKRHFLQPAGHRPDQDRMVLIGKNTAVIGILPSGRNERLVFLSPL